MENIREFKASKTIQTVNSTIYIGQINGEHAIYTLSYPTITRDEFNSGFRCENGKLVLQTKIVPRLTYPATEKHIFKYTATGRYVRETYDDYKGNDDFLKTSWLDNLVKSSKKPSEKCAEEILFENDHYIIIADYKWDKKSSSSLYLLMIFKNDKYRSIREIDDLDLLKSAKADSYKQCLKLGVNEEDVCLYFHYRPSYFRLHLHIVNISVSRNLLGASARNVLLDDVIRNFEMDSEYYKGNRFIVMSENE